MNSTNFFFYNKMKNEKLINSISKNYKIQNACISVNSYNNNNLELGQGKKLEGKLVFFYSDLQPILDKINSLSNDISMHDDKKHKLNIVRVYTSDYSTYKAYIIY